ncbi:hypothetical protein DM01DRAFT_151308 [Hesseltinella vesiculosa]|uniref:Uncharacterized protein n=1 Tax=Hesseltinella vesiculosa TaxID=101127 RepID=A0A1X2GYW1_9FUNG|nr:hypothetical protein DM01DRAFT_151308 [Hesseltinella vesiculosa]
MSVLVRKADSPFYSLDPVDLQSGTFFPPLPGGKTEPMTVSALLIERLSAADVVKKGQQAQPAVSSTSPAPASPPLSPPQEPAQDKAALNLTSPVVSTTAPTNPPTEIVQEDGFPVLGGAKDPSLVNGSQPPSFSYADMLKRD